jgi:dynein intermediate chain
MADASSTRTQRATALEEKRRRLEDLKKRRTQRVDDPTNKPAVAANLDEYIDGLLSVAAPPVSVGGSEETVVVATTPVSSAQQQQQTTAAGGETPPAASSSSEPPATAELPPSRPIVETFTIATQTEMEDVMEYNTADTQEEEDGDKALLMTTTIGDDSALQQQQQQQHIPKHLDSHQIQQTIISMSSPADFASFITTASKKVERLLGASRISDDDDLLIDYVGASTETSSSNNSNNNNERQFVSSKQIYECPKWTHTREVTDMDWSNLHRDVLLATYHMPNSSSSSSNSNYSNNHHKKGSTAVSAVSSKQSLSASMMTPRSGELQSDGLVLLWNLTMLQRPEHIFTCGSPVLCGTFHSLVEPTLVLGGCESGQLVIWDTRAGRLPVQKSALSSVVGASSKGHAHPITTMKSMEGGVSSSDDDDDE